VSRSTPLRRPVADVMAADALKLVKKWARDRCGHLVWLMPFVKTAVHRQAAQTANHYFVIPATSCFYKVCDVYVEHCRCRCVHPDAVSFLCGNTV
jgi:hypothetical protein